MTEPVAARPASTVLVVRDGASGLEVFMVVRHHQIDFASGALVFPGGSLDPEDAEIAGGGGFEAQERAMRVAAVRETFEECGLLLAREPGSGDWLDRARVAELAARGQGRSFPRFVEAERLELALDALVPFAHWITPKMMPKRFDTRFYIVAAPPDQIARHDGSESVDSVWIDPRRAIAEAEKGAYTIIPVTRLNLKMLGESGDVASALAAARARSIVTVEPVAEKMPNGWRLRIPLEAGYGVDSFFFSPGSRA